MQGGPEARVAKAAHREMHEEHMRDANALMQDLSMMLMMAGTDNMHGLCMLAMASLMLEGQSDQAFKVCTHMPWSKFRVNYNNCSCGDLDSIRQNPKTKTCVVARLSAVELFNIGRGIFPLPPGPHACRPYTWHMHVSNQGILYMMLCMMSG